MLSRSQRDSAPSSRGRDAPRSRKKGSLVCKEESGKPGPRAGKVTSAVQGRARPSLFQSHPQHLSTPFPGDRDLPWGCRAPGLREAQVSAARQIAEQPRREGGPARPHASPFPVRPPGARSLWLTRPSPAALRATPESIAPACGGPQPRTHHAGRRAARAGAEGGGGRCERGSHSGPCCPGCREAEAVGWHLLALPAPRVTRDRPPARLPAAARCRRGVRCPASRSGCHPRRG